MLKMMMTVVRGIGSVVWGLLPLPEAMDSPLHRLGDGGDGDSSIWRLQRGPCWRVDEVEGAFHEAGPLYVSTVVGVKLLLPSSLNPIKTKKNKYQTDKQKQKKKNQTNKQKQRKLHTLIHIHESPTRSAQSMLLSSTRSKDL